MAHGKKTSTSFSVRATALVKRGFQHVLPVAATGERKPYVKWSEASSDPRVFALWEATYESQFAPLNAAVVVGEDDGIWAVDVDEPDYLAEEWKKELPDTLRVRSGSGVGLHIFCKHDAYSRENLLPFGNFAVDGSNRTKALEVFAGRHTLHAIGSTHHKTQRLYEVEHDTKIRPASRAFVDFLVGQAAKAKKQPKSDEPRRQITGLVLRPEYTPEQLAERLDLVFKDGKLHPKKAADCPIAEKRHSGDSNTVWLFFYQEDHRTLRFYCGGGKPCGEDAGKKDRTRAALEALGLEDVNAWFSEPKEGKLLTSEPVSTALLDRCEKALLGREDGQRIFQRASFLTRIAHARELSAAEKDVVRRDDDAQVLVTLDELYIQRALGDTGSIFRLTMNGVEPGEAPRNWCRHIVNRALSDNERTNWPPLTFVSNTPIPLSTGELITQDGYHEKSGVYLNTRGVSFPPLPKKLTLGAAKKALEVFKEIYGSFPVSNKGGYEVIIAAHLDVLIRNLLSTVPGQAITAPYPGSGKTKIAEATALATTGKLPATFGYDGRDEFDKALVEPLRKGDRVICIDNVTQDHVFRSSRLNSALTSPGPFSCRILGVNDHVRLINNAKFIVDGNNLVIGGELPRRFLRTELDPDTERPQDRAFPFDPVERARQKFPELVIAGLTIFRAWQEAGEPCDLKSHLGSFEAWSRTVRACLLWVGMDDPVMTQLEGPEDPYVMADAVLLEKWFAELGKKEVTVADIGNNREIARLLTDDYGMFNAVKVGKRLSSMSRKIVHGYKLVPTQTNKTHSAKYLVEKVSEKEK